MNLDPARTAVLALHFERDIIEPDRPFGAAFSPMIVAGDVLPKTQVLLSAARAGGVLVVYARVAFAAGHPGLEPNTALHRAVLETNTLVKETSGTEIVEAVAPAPEDAVIDHEGTSAFVGGELQRLLEQRGIDTLLLAGVATNVIVEGTARDAGNLGYAVWVVGDCTAAGDPGAHEASLETLRLIIDGVVDSGEVVAALAAPGA